MAVKGAGRSRAMQVWQLLALALTTAAAVYLLTAPIYQPETECSGGATSSPTGEIISSWDTCDPPTSILAAGVLPYIAWMLAAVALAALPFAARLFTARRRATTALSAVSAIGLVAFVVTGGFAIGLLFIPGAACAVVGALLRRSRRQLR